MITVNMHEAKTRLSELVKAVEEQGETVTICRQGKPVVRLARVAPQTVDPRPNGAQDASPGQRPGFNARESLQP